MIQGNSSERVTPKGESPIWGPSRFAVILERVLRPLIRREIGRLFPRHNELLDDGELDALVAIWAAAQSWHENPDTAPDSIEAYSRTVARRTAEAMLRARHPERYRLSCRLRYALTHTPGLALWRNGERLIAGRVGEKDRPAIGAALVSDPDDARLRIRLSGKSIAEASLPELVAAILDLTCGPVAFTRLVSTLAALYQLPAIATEAIYLDDAETSLDRLLAQLAGVDTERLVELRSELATLWEEIQRLSLRQRMVLLLNLRDARGHGVIALLPLLGVATVEEIAAALETEVGPFQDLWERLPLPDEEIAALLGATPRQVIDLRYAARQKLAKRMREREREPQP